MRTTDLIKDSPNHSSWRRGFLLIPLALALAWRSFHGKTSPLFSLGWAFLPSAVAVLTLLLSTASSSVAGSASWKATPVDVNWNNAANWTVGGPPNGPADTASFATSNINPEIGAPTEVNGMVFNPGASAFTITSRMRTFTISGVGITNNSGIIQNFVSGPTVINFFNHATAGSLTHFTNTGDVNFSDSATAGNATFTNNAGLKFFANSTAGNATVTNNAEVLFQGNSTAGNSAFTNQFGIVIFSDAATAGNATFSNSGGAVSGTGGGFTVFDAGSTAGNAIVITNGATVRDAFNGENLFEGDAGSANLIATSGSNGGAGGFIQFRLGCTGGTARVTLFGNGTLDISQHNPPGVTTGSIQGNGLVFLGGVNLTVGANNVSTTFAGLIQDGGFSGGTGGSLTKIGIGTLTLAGANTYTGGTLINTGTLQASEDGALGEGDVSLTVSDAILRLQFGATNNYIANTATLSIVSGATVDLNFIGVPDTILSLIVDGVVQPAGLYGSAASGAPNQLPEFAGTGEILVTSSIPTPTAVSRKDHGPAGTFDIALPLSGEPGVECRSSGGNHTLVFTFGNNVVSGNATVTSGIGSVAGSPIFVGNTITVNLTGVTDVQKITVTLRNVTDSFGQVLPDAAVSVKMLIGDTNGNKLVNASDIGQTKGQSGAAVTSANFRTDINANGSVSASDIAQVKANVGHTLP